MAKEICISTTPHETRLAILEDDQLAEIYYERENEYTLAGSIYNGRVTRVLPGMQSAFVDVGLERDAFLYVTDFMEEQEDSEEYETSGAPSVSPRGAEEAAEETGGARRGRRDGRRGDNRRSESVSRAQESEPAAAPPEAGEAEQGQDGDADAPEGTRRWRGRRGRRRGGMRAGVLGAANPAAPEEQEATQESGPVNYATPERGAPGGLAAPAAFVDDDLVEENAAESSRLIDLHAGAASSTEENRGERGPERRPRAAAKPAVSEALVLPGESLSRYGAKPVGQAVESPVALAASKSASAAPPVNYTPPTPATQVDANALHGWDGGLVMPGESLSRHRTAPARVAEAAPEAEPATTEEAAAEPRAANDAGKDTAKDAAPALEPVEPPAEARPEPPVEVYGIVESRTEPPTEPRTEPEIESTQGAEPSDAPLEESSAERGEISAAESSESEYEPEGGSASVRIAPSGRSELRLSQLFGGSGGSGDKRSTEEPEGRKTPQDEPQTPEHEELHRSTLNAGEEGHVHEPTSEEASEPAREKADEPGLSQDAMETEPPEQREETQSESREEPISLREAATAHVHGGFTELVDQLHGYAPAGTGLLEEEVIDEDEYDFDPIHLHHDEHDLEEIEEETLHGEDRGEGADGSERSPAQSARQEDFDDSEDEEEPAALLLEEVDEREKEASAEPDGAESDQAAPGEARGRRGGRGNGRRRGAGGGGGRRQSAQTQDLPIISDLLKPGQEILVQIAKEPIAKKGARITSHIALPGRFLVFMPTVNHVGVSRKIESDGERQRLKRILISEKGESAGGFIVRTAADGASEDELRADLRFLINLWSEIKQRSEAAKSPALIYHDLNLVERILRDQVSSNFSTIWVDTEQEYERIVRFLNRFQPSLVRRVKLYTKETPLFEHFGITEEISKALKSKVWLKSGGSIVINQTEALVAIDINTGKYVGKTARLEDTIVKTNLDAIPEIVRQIRLRDLGGIIVIDFIDMDDRRNRNRVLAALEEAMKADRAPSKVLQFNDFGLVAITRKRVKQSLERTLSVQCEACTGTGMVKSPITVCNEIYIELRKMQKHLDGKDVMLRVNPEVVKQLKSNSGRWINEYEEMIGKTIIIKSDASLHPEAFDIH